jgi:hypothetical protein
MRGIWKQRNEFDQLERELRSERPSPRPEYLANLATQLRAERGASSHRPAMRYRVVVAVAMTSLLGVVGAASGGLKYANAASSHTVNAVTHVFSATNMRATAGTPGNNSAAATAPAVASNSAPASDAAAATAEANAIVAQSSNNQGSDRGSNGDSRSRDNGRGRDDNAFRHQYIEFVFICLRVPPRHPFIFITLRLPKLAADALVARGLATAGAC